MPKKPRKTHIGSRAWNTQIASDKARYKQEQEQPKNNKRKKWTNYDEESKPKIKPKYQQTPPRYQETPPRKPVMTSQRMKSLRALGLLPANDTVVEIKAAYKRMSLLYHPDKNSSSSALEMMKAINIAFEYLTNKNEN